jgi:hypothetical protein
MVQGVLGASVLRIFVSRGIDISAAILLFLMAVVHSQPGNAQTANISSGNCPYWIDVKTGEPVPPSQTVPIGVDRQELYRLQVTHDVQAHGASGRNYFRQPDGTWTDAATGQQLPPAQTVPIGIDRQELYRLQVTHDVQAHGASGRNYALIPCPPPTTQTSMSGGYLGGELAKNWGRVWSTESLATTDVVTNRFVDSGDPLGVGIVGGYNFKPWNNNIVVGPFASFDYLNQTINHNFAGGQFLGTTTHWFVNAGVKAGVVTAPGFYLYGLAGAAFLNHDLNVNFATAAQSNVTTPGFTAGFGGEYAPGSWRLAGHPISLFAQYQHTWWSNANFNTPASSPAFNYAFRREDDTFKLGVNFYFDAQPPASSPMFVKARPVK